MSPTTPTLNVAAFGKRIRSLRTEKGWTIAELARHAGLTESYVSNIEGGKRPNLSLATVISLARAFRVSLDYLAGFDHRAAPAVASDNGVERRFRRLETGMAELADLVRQSHRQSSANGRQTHLATARKKAHRKAG